MVPARGLVAIAALLALLLLPAGPALAQAYPDRAPVPAPGRELVIGTKVAAPFAMHADGGGWQGISIDLWRRVAERLGLRYRIVEYDTVQALLDAITSHQVDAAVSALTVTAARREAMDFTQPFYATGLGVAVAPGSAGWLPVLRAFGSFGFLQAVLTLLGIAVTVGVLIWLFERRHNEPYGGPPLRGLVAGLWWSAVAMTQAGAAFDGPKTVPGRILAAVWMVASVVTIAVFIAGITSALTTQRLQGLVRNANDLRSVRVGAVSGSSTVEFLDAQRIGHRGFTDAPEGLRALRDGRIDAFVYDRPLLAYMLHQDFPGLQLLGISLDSQSYAIALPGDDALRARLDVAMLETLRSPWWQDTLFRYLGPNGGEGSAGAAQ
ncbi:transporter substrate-binding domain-containing protein [Roseomonas sp. NAR14]|uniref:Transporter substrate-binding domain-containing protein n=1 Tax=Roseomonas acroporae TaxID=2937791 RepID=A0A9X1Y676_9PROT|nr:transporter substrate-binding domain-containing protein [Roseomonas acroporae]MCK8784734.1 transporter substrate-binding domain-containing protein [Roseomonas acroporae]